MSAPVCPFNLGPRRRRERMTAGLLAIGAGLGLAAYLALRQAPPLTRLTVFPPFWVGLLGVLQAGHGT